MVSEPFVGHEKTYVISPLLYDFVLSMSIGIGNKVVLRARNVLAPCCKDAREWIWALGDELLNEDDSVK